jgi:AcrR family transcriptional regulator
MRYGKNHKEETRQRVLDVAGRRFKEQGIGGSGVSALMSDAGLTNGAFYSHFESKEALVSEMLVAQLKAQRESMDGLPPGREGLEMLIHFYLSTEHRDNVAGGCPSAAMLDEISRRPSATKKKFTAAFTELTDEVATHMNPGDPEAARADAAALFGLMLGVLQLSRAVSDPALSEDLLDRGRDSALQLVAAYSQ